jgi:hypothetical protein
LYLIYSYTSTNTDAEGVAGASSSPSATPQAQCRPSQVPSVLALLVQVQILTQYKSANTDTGAVPAFPGTQCTCCTSTNVQILTQKALCSAPPHKQLGLRTPSCFTGTKVQILTLISFPVLRLINKSAYVTRPKLLDYTGAQFTCCTGTKVQILTLLDHSGPQRDAVPVWRYLQVARRGET